MAQSQLVAGGSATVSDNSTRWVSISGIFLVQTNEAFAATAIRDAGTFTNLFVYVPTNTATVTSTITLQKSLVDTALTVSYTSTQTGIKEDTANSVSFAATDEAAHEITVPDTVAATSIIISVIGVSFTPTTTTDCITNFVTSNVANFGTASVTYFMPPNGSGATPTATENNVKYRARFSFISSNFYSWVQGNSRTTDIVFGTRKNGVAGAQSVTYTSGQTGAKEDTVNTDSLVAGDDYNYFVTTLTGTENAFLRIFSSVLVNTSSIFTLLNADPDGGAVAFNTTTYTGMGGGMTFNATEANNQIYPRFTFTASELGAYVSANTIATSATTVTLMDNGSASALTVSYDPAQTGLKNDSANTVEITSGTDEIDYRVVTPNTSGSLTFRWVGMLGAVINILHPMIQQPSLYYYKKIILPY